jgi:hypothetical protein
VVLHRVPLFCYLTFLINFQKAKQSTSSHQTFTMSDVLSSYTDSSSHIFFLKSLSQWSPIRFLPFQNYELSLKVFLYPVLIQLIIQDFNKQLKIKITTSQNLKHTHSPKECKSLNLLKPTISNLTYVKCSIFILPFRCVTSRPVIQQCNIQSWYRPIHVIILIKIQLICV